MSLHFIKENGENQRVVPQTTTAAEKVRRPGN